jgi:hypothetical protein
MKILWIFNRLSSFSGHGLTGAPFYFNDRAILKIFPRKGEGNAIQPVPKKSIVNALACPPVAKPGCGRPSLNI